MRLIDVFDVGEEELSEAGEGVHVEGLAFV
jgi:hypothetical protein